MYADDGIMFPSEGNDLAKLSDPGRGISPNVEKSGWVKRAGMWTKNSVKFLGLKFYPSEKGDPKLASCTRNGGELEYNLAAQLLTYLKGEWSKVLTNTQGIILSTRQLNSPYSPYSQNKSKSEEIIQLKGFEEKVVDQTIKEWLEAKVKEFSKQPAKERLGLLFTKWGLKALAEMFNGQWGIPSYEPQRQYVKGSWLHIHGARFQHEEIRENWFEHLTINYWKRINRLSVIENLPTDPYEIWRSEWWSGLVGAKFSEALKLEVEMSESFSILEKYSDTEVFSRTLNSLFKWNIPKERGPIDWDLHKVMSKLLRDFPYEAESLSSMAISDYLTKGICADRDIRSCIALKTKGTLVSRIPRDRSPKKSSKIGASKDFTREFSVNINKLSRALDS